MMRLELFYAVVALCVVCLFACSESDRTRQEARRMLALYKAIDHKGALSPREQKVNDLAQLPLDTQVVQQARDACVGAHRALISAEQAHERAAASLDRVLADKPDGQPLGANESALVQREIESAEHSLRQARERFSPCEDQVQSLALRFGEKSAG
jgi:hypothetical protein